MIITKNEDSVIVLLVQLGAVCSASSLLDPSADWPSWAIGGQSVPRRGHRFWSGSRWGSRRPATGALRQGPRECADSQPPRASAAQLSSSRLSISVSRHSHPAARAPLQLPLPIAPSLLTLHEIALFQYNREKMPRYPKTHAAHEVQHVTPVNIFFPTSYGNVHKRDMLFRRVLHPHEI